MRPNITFFHVSNVYKKLHFLTRHVSSQSATVVVSYLSITFQTFCQGYYGPFPGHTMAVLVYYLNHNELNGVTKSAHNISGKYANMPLP